MGWSVIVPYSGHAFTPFLFSFLSNRPRVAEQLVCINANACQYMLHCKDFATRGERRVK